MISRKHTRITEEVKKYNIMKHENSDCMYEIANECGMKNSTMAAIARYKKAY
jgi:hypothetical protein